MSAAAKDNEEASARLAQQLLGASGAGLDQDTVAKVALYVLASKIHQHIPGEPDERTDAVSDDMYASVLCVSATLV